MGFFLGLAVDILSDTPGMNAAATVLLAFCALHSYACLCLAIRWIHWFRQSVQWESLLFEILGCQCLGASRDAAYS